MKKNKYLLVKEKKYKKYININVDVSFDMKKKKDKDSIGTIKFYDEIITDKVITKSIENRFKKLLEFVVECEEDSDPEGLLLALNETEKFKREMINKYEKFLHKKKMEFNQKKVDLIIQNLKKKLITYRLMQTPVFIKQNDYQNEDYEDDYEEERHRTR